MKRIIFIDNVLHRIAIASAILVPTFYLVKMLYEINVIVLTPPVKFTFLSIGMGILRIALICTIFILIGLCFPAYRKYFWKPLIYMNVAIVELIVITEIMYPLVGIN